MNATRQDSILEKNWVLAALVLLAALAVYYPVLHAGFINLDDWELVNRMNDAERPISIKGLFFREHSTFRYFRPMVILSFMLDQAVWKWEAGGYHFTNYVLHALSALLLLFIALRFFQSRPQARPAALFCALLFALHPLTTESVSWICGRSDVIATFFCMAAGAGYFLRTPVRFLLVPLCYLLGLFTKESALSLFPLLVLLHAALEMKSGKSLRGAAGASVKWFLILLVPTAVYFYLRMGVGGGHVDQGIARAIQPDVSDAVPGAASISPLLYLPAAIGFYIKKLFIPYPLNFAITQIHTTLYAWVFAGISLATVLPLLWRRVQPLIWVGAFVLAFAPALPVALGRIAWVPFAERYGYLAAVVWALAMGSALLYGLETFPGFRKPAVSAAILLILLWGGTTFQRVLVFQDNATLWADTLRKNPTHGKILFKYGCALNQQGNSSDGLACFRSALDLRRDDQWKELSCLALAKHARSQGQWAEAERYLSRGIEIKPSTDLLLAMAGLQAGKPAESAAESQANIRRAAEMYRKVYRRKRRPFYLYQSAKLLMRIQAREAEEVLQEIVEKHPRSKTAGYARKLLKGGKGSLQDPVGEGINGDRN